MECIDICDIELKAGMSTRKWLGPLIQMNPETSAIKVGKS